MSADGQNLAKGKDEALVVDEQEQHLIRFLQEGLNRDQDMHDAKKQLVAIYGNLKSEVAWGYALAMNDTFYYRLNSAQNPSYPARCEFGPCDESSIQPA
ncbi:hypothetical protein ABVN23_29200 [Pseudomonas fluorescens]|uniref:hypothetical protein n=1 Tax=Pseudomonas TaxID=286 RepID=UPI0021180158|nr:hypothetical protein [Pseudomonas sp. Pse1]